MQGNNTNTLKFDLASYLLIWKNVEGILSKGNSKRTDYMNVSSFYCESVCVCAYVCVPTGTTNTPRLHLLMPGQRPEPPTQSLALAFLQPILNTAARIHCLK